MDHWELESAWYGPIDFRRVLERNFTASMQDVNYGLYVWGATRGDQYRTLYVGKSHDPKARQQDHLNGPLGERCQRIAEQRWKVEFWMGHLSMDELPRVRSYEALAEMAMTAAEKCLIYYLQPRWNRRDSGYIELDRGIRLTNTGRTPPNLGHVIRLNAGLHV